MMHRILVALLLPLPLLAQALLAQTTVRGIVTEQNSGNRAVPGVQIRVLGAAPELSDNAGAFALSFPAKKPGERIVVSDIAKPGYEIVNKDLLSNWLIPADPQARTKIVMCPEGTLARNILKYYNISLDALTKGYHAQLRKLQDERDAARLDAASYGARAQALTERFTAQQKQLEELAERFARENFDDCSDVQRRAFAAFSSGNVEEAIRILESVNSGEEIAKAQAQKERGARMAAEGARMTAEGARMATEGASMQAQSDSVIRQHIRKLLFQAGLYVASNRYEEAAQAYESAARADTTNFFAVLQAAEFFANQRDMARAPRWNSMLLAVSRAPLDSAIALQRLASLDRSYNRLPEAERKLIRALALARRAGQQDMRNGPIWVAEVLGALADILEQTSRIAEADSCAREALVVHRWLMARDPGTYGRFVVASLLRIGALQCDQGRCDSGEVFYREALAILNASADTASLFRKYQLSEAYASLGAMYFRKRQYTAAEPNFRASLRLTRELAAINPDAYGIFLVMRLGDLAHTQHMVKHYDSAEASQRALLALLVEQERKDPDRTRHLRAQAMVDLAALYDAWGRHERAIRASYDAIPVVASCAEANPAAYGLMPLGALHVLAAALWHAGRLDSAEVVYADIMQQVRASTAADPRRNPGLLFNTLYTTAGVIYPQRLQRAVEYMQEALQIIRGREGGPANTQNVVAAVCRELAKYMILSRKPAEAETYAREAIARVPEATARRYLAAGLLYQGRYEEARAVYAELMDQLCVDAQTYREAFLEDFDEFERAGVTHPDVARIRALIAETPEKKQ